MWSNMNLRKYDHYVTGEKSAIGMTFGHIKNLLQLSWHFNTSSINHSFSIGEKDRVTVRCITGTFIFEVISSETQQVDYYTSIDLAAEALYTKINANHTNWLPGKKELFI